MAFKAGDFIWVQKPRYPLWPAKIEEPSGIPKTKDSHYVFFFGSEKYAWISDIHIIPHNESILKTFGDTKKPAFKKAVDDFISFSKDNKKGSSSPVKTQKDKIETDTVIQATKKDDRKVFVNKSPKILKKRSFDDVSDSFSPKLSKNLSQDGFFTQKEIEELSKIKPIEPSSKKFGFIAFGNKGRRNLMLLIETGHDVTMLNNVCARWEFTRVKKAETPADLVMQCDIVLSCVSDIIALKAFIFGPRGILEGFQQAERANINQPQKGYVEMSCIDFRLVSKISKALSNNRGLFLTAPFFGTDKDVEDGTSTIIASGDRHIFEYCWTCFRAIGLIVLYESHEPGYSAEKE